MKFLDEDDIAHIERARLRLITLAEENSLGPLVQEQVDKILADLEWGFCKSSSLPKEPLP